MKILLKIAITFILFIGMLCGLLFTATNTGNVSDLENASASLQMLSALENVTGTHDTYGDMPTAAQYQRAVFVDVLFTILCILGIVFTFVNRKTAGLVVAGVLALSAILFFVMQPRLNGTAFAGDNTDATFATFVGIFVLLAAGLLVLLKVKFSGVAASQGTPMTPN